jgi:hypothetical protein
MSLFPYTREGGDHVLGAAALRCFRVRRRSRGPSAMAVSPSGSWAYAKEITQTLGVDAFAIENGKPAQLAKSHAAIVTGSVRAQATYAQCGAK